ncbi:MAG: Trk system potassium uptake protein TrkA [Acidimicrobiales bacterium]|nr:MAG: Trk system potassium uptake protein TrkA [Acidimicrobiales bacterium]
MHYVVVGCGRVGSMLASQLDDMGHSVAVVDRDPSAFRRLRAGFGGLRIEGVGFDRSVLRAAGIEEAAALAAVTNGDNSNIVAARVAKEEFGVEKVVARIYDPRRAAIYERMGVTTVPTATWTTEQVLARVLPDRSSEEWSDPSGKVVLVVRDLPQRLVGSRLLDIESDGVIRIAAVMRCGEALLATGETLGQEGDRLALVVSRDRIEEVRRLLAPSGAEDRGETGTSQG